MPELTAEKKRLLVTEGHILALGGPGSGKTYIALLKADREIRAGKLLRGQRVLFLSFARATIARVAQQVGKLITGSEQESLEINTYHGFAWKLLRSHGYLLNNGNPIRLLPPPEAASRLAEVDGDAARTAEKRRLFQDEGLLHFDLFADLCANLLLKSKALARIVSDAYSIVILDEFQDTNSDEWLMIQALGARSRLIALADAEQRIYEFRGADPMRISEFIAAYKPAQFDFGSENNRSNGTDITVFGKDLLTEANKAKNYNDVVLIRYGFYRGRSAHYAMKGALIQAINRLKSGPGAWSVAVLVPTKRLMLQVSDYLTDEADAWPSLNHDVALDTEAPALAAALIAGVLEGGAIPAETAQRLIVDLCTHIRGRNGNNPPNQVELGLAGALGGYLQSGTVRGKKREQIVQESIRIAEERHRLDLSGDPWEDWLAVRRLLAGSDAAVLRQIAEDAKYLRLLHKGAALRSRLGELWRTTAGYLGAASAVRDALLQEHFSTSTKEWRGVHVMTIHKSKGKEFDEVIVYEGSHQGRIVRANASERDNFQARLALRVAVTRAMKRATILTPKNDVCSFL
ncbi:MAG: UvrD-helicase domain-containing protein [Acidobacteria bacterium]|nr:UvrD-helicase domain-containing protein [Acidobacteriota bacterium]MCI0724693.1 UvrD-helicase domain-containing protein [Acidobacteriota bacterium]